MTDTLNSPTIPESHKDLLTAPVAVLATHGADGFPQVSAVWFVYDEDGAFRLSLASSRQKIKNIEARPEVTLFILDPNDPYRTIEIRARADMSADEDGAFGKRLGEKYGGADVRSYDKPGETRHIATLQPVKVNTYG